MGLTTDSLETVNQIAALMAMQVPHEQIAEVIGFSPEALEEIVSCEEYKQHYQEFLAEEFNKQFKTARTWDDIENKSLRIVSEALDLGCDPEFALKAGVMANKANRHGFRTRVDPIDLEGGARRVITLNTTFVEKIENKTVVYNGNGVDEKPNGKIIDNGQSKVVDAVSPPELKRIMGSEEPDDSDALAAVEEIL